MTNELDTEPGKREKPKALTDWAYMILQKEILDLRATPGSQLHVEELSEKLGISRTPVREALLRLKTAGLVQVLPRVGFFVANITVGEIVELFELREWLESQAAAKVAPMLAEKELVYLDELMDSTALAVEQGDVGKFLEVEESFHDFIIRRCGNKHLLNVIESMYNLIRRERILSIRSKDNIERSLVEHRLIVSAFHDKNSTLASAAMSAHIRAAGVRLCSNLGQKLDNIEKGV